MLLGKETLLPLAKAAAQMPVIRGERFHASTLRRWIQAGRNGVRLEALRVGGSWCTSMEAIERFCLASSSTIGATTAADLRNKKSPTGPYDPVGVRERLRKLGMKI